MGVRPQDYAPQLSKTWSESMRWTNGEGHDKVKCDDNARVHASEVIATEELMMMTEN